MLSGIYIIQCVPTNQNYVGGSINITSRFGRHRFDLRHGVHANRLLQTAWNQYGEAAFTFSVVETVERNRATVTNREQVWIDSFEKTDLFNILPNAGLTRGVKRTEETKQRCSTTRKALFADGYIHPNKGRKWPKEFGQKISDSTKGRIPWNKGKKGVQVGWNKGKTLPPMSDQHKARIADSMKRVRAENPWSTRKKAANA